MKKETTKPLAPPPELAIVTGYKATNHDLTCTPGETRFQYEVGVWYHFEGDLNLCGNGFHYCDHPSGVWAYYSGTETRVWKIEAAEVLDGEKVAGADRKRVSRWIRLVQEITPGAPKDSKGSGNQNTGYRNTGDWNTGNQNTGNRNTGDQNTGYWNTGNRNTGYWNTGDRNTGDQNTGNRNTGNRNTGYQNTGNRNTGYWNTGYRNTGDWNTGNQNTGNRNTGDQNTGYWNTGDWNATNYSSGFFCQKEPTVICFDVDTGMTRASFESAHGFAARMLGEALLLDKRITMTPYASLPGITSKKLQSLHAKFKAARKAAKK